MKRWLPFPLLWTMLVAMWLVLNQTLDAAHVVLAALVALAAVHALAALQSPQTRLPRPLAAAELLLIVVGDIVRSNVAVAWIVLRPRAGGRNAEFAEIPLTLRNPVGLAALACIVTSAPGTVWAGYDSQTGVMTLHVLDLVNAEQWVDRIKTRYERRLIAILGAD
jgi:multicomponent K+:H+ antiporter subunit E